MAGERLRPGVAELQPPERPELRLLRAGLRSLAEAGLRAPEAARLRALHLHGNALQSLQGLDAVCRVLEELVASSNDLRSLHGLQGLHNLRLLDISCNCLSSLEGLGRLRLLEELRAAYNQIRSLQDLLPLRGPDSRLRLLDLRDNAIGHLQELVFLGGLQSLEDFRLQGAGGRRANPVCRMPGYRPAVLCAAPDLQLLDEEGVAATERFGDALRLVVPETWPTDRAQDAPKVAPAENAAEVDESKEAQPAQLAQLRARLSQKMQACSEARQRARAAEESLASMRAEPPAAAAKLSRQLQQELRLVASEAKRRQVMNAELKTRLSETFREVHLLEGSTRQAGDELFAARRACHRAREQRFKAVVEAEAFASAASAAAQRREEGAARLSQERKEADELLLELTEKTEASAAVSAQLRGRAAEAASRRAAAARCEEELCRLQSTAEAIGEDLRCAERAVEESEARCHAEAATADALRRLRQEAAADSAGLLEREEAALRRRRSLQEAAEAGVEAQSAQLAERRRQLETEISSQRQELKALEERNKARQREEASAAAAAEQRFGGRRRGLAEEARQLQEELDSVLGAAAEEEQALRGQRRRSEACQASESALQAALAKEAAAAELCEGKHREAEERCSQRQADLHLAEARQLGLERKRDATKAELAAGYVEPSLLEACESEFASQEHERSELRAAVVSRRTEESQAAAALAASESPERLQEELLHQQARVDSLTAEFHDADQQMDLLAATLQELREEAAARDLARAKRQADWRKAEAEVQARLADAFTKEEAAEDMAEALCEELHRLQQDSEQFDEDLAWLESRVDEVREYWMLEDEAEAAELSAVEARCMRSAEEAEHQLGSLGKALSRELRQRSEVNRKIEEELEQDQQLLRGYRLEEAALQETWNAERQALAQEAASVASELQRLAQGIS